MQSKSYLLNKENSLILRGLAIIAIMYHNLLHDKFFGLCQENEGTFIQENADAFFGVIGNFDNQLLFQLSSFLGWIGVPVFVFLTGYGLAKKYPSQHSQIHKRSFLKRCYLKLFFLLCPVLLFYAFVDAYLGEWGNLPKRLVELTMLYNLDYPDFRVPPGVYWYFSLTFQLYILYCFFYKYLTPIKMLIMSVLSLLVLYLLITADLNFIRTIYRVCFPGWFPLFAIGIWMANDDRLMRMIEGYSIYKTIILLMILLFFVVIMNFNIISWLFIPIVSLFLFFLLSKIIVNIEYMDGLFKWIGRLSAFIFVCHPVAVRIVILLCEKINISGHGIWLSLIVYTVLTFVMSLFYEKLYNQLSKRFIK